jgi:putative FmdB family regulatory protein
MPTYVYACDTCGAQFEQFQSFKDEPLRTCPSCASAVRRVFQPVGIVFKGSGWYITDSRKSSSATVGSEETGTKTEKPSSGESASKNESASKSESTGSESASKSESSSKSESTSETKSNSASASTTA